jgi:hypothetical protein
METVDAKLLHSTTDAAVWAAEFMKIAPEVDEGAMIGWFANAIENGRDAGRKKALAEVAEALDALLFPLHLPHLAGHWCCFRIDAFRDRLGLVADDD